MTGERPPVESSLLDDWVADIGEEAVAAAVADARRRIADGSIPAFADKDQFLAYISREHTRRSA